MTLYTAFSILIVLSALFAYINFRFIKLPLQIGLMLLAIITSLSVIAIGTIQPSVFFSAKQTLLSFDFSELLLGSMLSFMLFAGAIHIKLDTLKQESLPVILFSTMSVLLSTLIIGIVVYYLLILFKLPAPFIHCLLFGSLISPTDPIAILGILKESKISKSLEMKIAGESLFNDGVAVVLFLTIFQIAEQHGNIQIKDVTLLFIREAFGGILLGVAVGYTGFLLIRSIDNYKVEVLLTIAIVMGGYSLADFLRVSGPLAMVAAGIITGNQVKKFAMSKTTSEYIDLFWELINEMLNAILFVIMGLELLVIHFVPVYISIGLITIVFVLAARYMSVFLPAQVIRLKEKIDQHTILLMTWGGLRGGISIALALSLKPEMEKNLWVTLTYFVVVFSILIQGLTVGKLAKARDR